jgi:hypothetical protein
VTLRRAVGYAAVIAPALHLTSDAMEWLHGGFTPLQLLINYAAFVPMPLLLPGLVALQRPRISPLGWIGALLWALAFVYFTHTTLTAQEHAIPDYPTLLAHLGGAYTVHGLLMISGGLLFAVASLRAGVLSRRWLGLFMAGLGLNLLVGLLPLPDLLQTLGSALRNIALMGIGVGLLKPDRVRGQPPS